MTLPNTLFIGPGRTGTTSIFRSVSRHSMVCAAKQKEVDRYRAIIFGRDLPPLNEYETKFSHCTNKQVIIEATPGYFFGGSKVAEQVVKELGKIRAIVTLRDPIDRLLSLYKHVKSKLLLDQTETWDEFVQHCMRINVDGPFDEMSIQYSGFWEGIYVIWLKQWCSILGNENVKVVFFDDWIQNAYSVLFELALWLGIDPSEFKSMDIPHDNRSMYYRSRLLQKIALSINSKFEFFFAKHYRIKRLIRNCYYLVNGIGFEKKNESLKTPYKQIYEDYNKQLRKFLLEMGYTSLPPWLHEAK